MGRSSRVKLFNNWSAAESSLKPAGVTETEQGAEKGSTPAADER